MSFRSSGSHESNYSNGTRFRVEMKELDPLEVDHTKLKANFMGFISCELERKSKVNDHLEWKMLGERHEPLQVASVRGPNSYTIGTRINIFPGKLKSRWIGPFTIQQVHSNGVVELLNFNSTGSFKVNGHHLKPFMEPFS
ncbi:hypothetical protein AAG906_025096 [Vitis piasezkii]